MVLLDVCCLLTHPGCIDSSKFKGNKLSTSQRKSVVCQARLQAAWWVAGQFGREDVITPNSGNTYALIVAR
jgi:hypothetical protein